MVFEDKLVRLREVLREVHDLYSAAAVLGWDQQTFMPSGGATARGRQIATLTRLAHERFASAEVGELLDALEPHVGHLPPDSDEACLIRVTRRDFERDTRIPSTFWSDLSEHSAVAYQAWAEARPANDFASVVPHLERTLELSRRYSSYFPEAEHIADPLIDMSDEGMTVARLRPLFAELRAATIPLLRRVLERQTDTGGGLRRVYDEEAQLAFGLEVVRDFGFDFRRGRQDRAHHPFATSFSVSDVRITTRARRDDLSEALFSTLHEAGHAMYEQGIDPALESTPLGTGVSSGVHESQSRLWENIVGRGLTFWNHYFPKLREAFAEQLRDVDVHSFYAAVNRVAPSLIRTDADELTYNLHVLIRFDLELAMLEGTLRVEDLPEAWRDGYDTYLGVQPETDADGVLQDVHWFAGLVGGSFQGYALGNVLSAQFYDAAVRAHPEIPTQVGAGEFRTLHAWLRENLYRHGRKFPAAELVRRATGSDMHVAPYIDYLHAKYGSLHGLSARQVRTA